MPDTQHFVVTGPHGRMIRIPAALSSFAAYTKRGIVDQTENSASLL